MTFSALVKTIKGMLKPQTTISVKTLPKILLLCSALHRPGRSAMAATLDIINKNAQSGIPTGPNVDGSQNLINTLVYNIVSGIIEHDLLNMGGDIVIPPHSLRLKGFGANSGGPVVVDVTNEEIITLKNAYIPK